MDAARDVRRSRDEQPATSSAGQPARVNMFRCPSCTWLNEQPWVCECGQPFLHYDDTEVYVSEAAANEFIVERKNTREAETKAREENEKRKPQEEMHSQWKCDYCNKSFKTF